MNVLNIERTIEMLHGVDDEHFCMAYFIQCKNCNFINCPGILDVICETWPFGDDIPEGVSMCLTGHIANNFAPDQLANSFELVARFFRVNETVARNLVLRARTYGRSSLDDVTREDVIEKLESMI